MSSIALPRDWLPRDWLPRDWLPRDWLPRGPLPRDWLPRGPLPRGPLPCAIALAAGIAAAPRLDLIPLLPEPARWAIAMVLAAVAALRWPRLALLAVFAAGAARGARPPVQPPPETAADDRIADRAVGEIAGPVARSPRGFGARLEPDGGADAIWLWTDEPVAPGERIAATGYLRAPRGSLGPGQPDRADAVAARGARLELTAHAGSIERLADEPGAAARAWRWAATQRARAAAAIDRAGGRAGGAPAARAALRGITVGDRADVPPELDARWRAAGIYHVLSVSGLHLAVVAGLLFALLRRLVAASPWGGRVRPARWAAPPALAAALAYTMITGAEVATLRALVVAAAVLAAAALDRPVRLADALGLAALALLWLRPADLFDPGFQLSFTAAATLALRPPGGRRRGVAGWLARAAAASAWIAVTTAPLTAFHFHEVALCGVAGNVVLTPLLELLALPLALGGLALGWDAPVGLAARLVELADGAAGLLARVAPVGRVAVATALLTAALVALSLWLAARAVGRRRAAALGWAALCAGWALGRATPPAGALRVTFLDVGQGDAALVELPDGAVWLVDAGGLVGARDATAAAAAPGRVIRRALAAYGHDRVDLAIVSHPHPDHYLGLAALGVPVGELWTAREPEPHGPQALAPRAPEPDAPDAPHAPRAQLPPLPDVLAGLAARGTRAAHPPLGLARARAGVELVVWGPRHQPQDGGPVAAGADPVRSVNDNSLVVELRYRGRALLFLGDLEAEGEAILAEAGLGPVDVVKIAHHGSATSSTASLIDAVRPALAVISCGRANRFGFPSPEVLERWRAAGADIARTDLDGAVTVTVDAAGRLEVERFAR